MARTRARLLLVEEDQEAARLLGSLRAHGFEVTVASGGVAAQDAIARFRFDVAFSGMQGDSSLLATLKAADPQMEVVVAAPTAEAASGLVRDGAFACVTRPYDTAEVRMLIDSAAHASGRLFGCVTLYEASRRLLATLKQSDLVPLVMSLADRVMPSDGIGLVLTGAAAPTGFECHASHGIHDLSRLVLVELAAAASAAGRHITAPPDALLPAECDKHGIASFVTYPLSSTFGALGALVFFRQRTSPAFSQVELDRGQGFASQVSLAVENAQTYREVEEKMRSLLRTQDQTQLRARISAAAEVGSVLAHEVNNPLAALACNLEALQEYSTDVESLWGAAKAAAEFLLEQAEPTGQRLSERVLGDASKSERTDRMVTEVASAIDECLSGVRRIADLVRTLHDVSRLRPQNAPEHLGLGELLADCAAKRPRGMRRLDVISPAAPSFALLARDDFDSATHQILQALDRLPGAKQPVTLAVEHADGVASITITDVDLSLAPNARGDAARFSDGLRGGSAPIGHVALHCALASAFELFERNGATVAVESVSPKGTRFVFAFPSAQ